MGSGPAPTLVFCMQANTSPTPEAGHSITLNMRCKVKLGLLAVRLEYSDYWPINRSKLSLDLDLRG